LPHRV